VAVIARSARRPATLSVRQLDGATWALGVGGLLFSVGNLLHPLEHADAAYVSPTWTAAHLIIFASLPMLILGLSSVGQVLRRREAGPITRVAVWLATVGLIGMAPGLLAEAFLAPQIGQAAMERLDATGFGVIGGILALAWVASSVVLAAACQRARFGPIWSRATLVVCSVALVFGAVPGPVGGGVIIVATAAYGVAVAALGWALVPR